MSVDAVWVADSANFVVAPLGRFPLRISEAGTIDVTVTTKARDGMTRSTEVWYRDSHGGSASYTVTMTAPRPETEEVADQPYHGKPVYPNPAKDFCTLDIDIRLYPNVQVDLYGSNGARVLGIVKPTGDKLVVDTRNLANGKYSIVVSSNGAILRNEEVVVRH